MNPFIQQLKDFYAGLEPKQQKLFLGAVVGSVVMLIGVGVWAQGETWTPVLSGGSDEVRQAAGALSEQDISYRIRNEGTTLEVVEAQAGRAQLAVAGQGLRPDAVAEYDLPVGLPPAMQQRILIEMQQNELAHMIRQIDVVEYAWVSITEAKTGTYLTDDTEARASIVLKLVSGAKITDRQIQSIVNLTAMAVKDLDPGRISVSDQDGNVLHAPDSQGITAGGSELLTLQLQREQALESSIMEALTKLLGTPNAVTVHATLELDHSVETILRSDIDPDRVVALTERSSESSRTEGEAKGAAGTASNTGEGMVGESGQSSDSMQIDTTYAAARSETVVEKRPGNIERMSVMVLVDETHIRDLAIAKLGPEAEEAAIDEKVQAIQAQIERSVTSATGFKSDRGDVVDVGFVPFAPLPVMVEAGPAVAASTALPWMPYAIAMLALALVFGFVVRPVVKAVTRTPEEIAAAIAAANGETPGAEDESTDEDDDLAARLRLLVENYEPVDAADLNRLVDREAEAAAQVLRQWSAK